MHIWKTISTNIGAFTRSSRLKGGHIFLNRQHFCDQRIPISRTAILEKGIERKRVMDVTEGTICSICDLSPSVKGLKLNVPSKDFTFKAGQWVDFLVPNMNEVAGYSICSSPKFLLEKNTIELAVKYSDFSPTKWVHKKSQIGSQVGLVVGGDFCYAPDSTDDSCKDLLLVAGGVGINPLISIIRHVADLKRMKGPCLPGRVVLIYSAPSFDDLIFKDEIRDVVSGSSEMKATFCITQHDGKSLTDFKGVEIITNHRVDGKILSSILQTEFTDVRNIDCYVCGPSSMIDDIDRILLELKVSPDQIKYEKWW